MIMSSFKNALGVLKGGETIILDENLMTPGTDGPL